MSPTRRPRRRVAWVGALAATALAAAVAAVTLGSPPSVLPAPPAGTVRPDALDDGRPVLVVGRGAGVDPVVLDARQPVGAGWAGVVGWCEPDASIVDRLSGRRWTRLGHPQLPAGPGRAIEQAGTVAPPLARYAVDAAGGQVRVGERQRPDPHAPVREVRRFDLCAPEDVATVPLPGEPVEPAQLAGADDGWHRIPATLTFTGARPRLCAASAAPPCAGPALPQLPQSARPLVATAFRGRVAVRVRDGEVDRVWVPADIAELR